MDWQVLIKFIKNIITSGVLVTAAKIGAIVILSLIAIKLCKILTERLKKIIEKTEFPADERMSLRTRTLAKITDNFAFAFIGVTAIMLIIAELGINVAPILAGAGILGMAISFGAQSLVRDIITGFFILFEDQYGIGDIVKIGDHSGVVENMNVRATTLRDLLGNVHIISNGEIKTVTVMTKDWSKAVIDIKILFCKQDIQAILDVILEEAEKLASEWHDIIIDRPEILGVDSLNLNTLVVKTVIRTKPAQQWHVEREFRKRIAIKFNELNINAPVCQIETCL